MRDEKKRGERKGGRSRALGRKGGRIKRFFPGEGRCRKKRVRGNKLKSEKI